MATMYPPELMPTEGRHGEYLIYTLLRDALTEPSWHVFYNLRFHLDSSGTRTREVDFVVLHPDRGCLLIEVKGGEYVHDSARGWCRVYRGELQPDTQHGGPFQQIESAGFALIRAISEAFRWTPKDVPFAWGTAVALPNRDGPIGDHVHVSSYTAAPPKLPPEGAKTASTAVSPNLLESTRNLSFLHLSFLQELRLYGSTVVQRFSPPL